MMMTMRTVIVRENGEEAQTMWIQKINTIVERRTNVA